MTVKIESELQAVRTDETGKQVLVTVPKGAEIMITDDLHSSSQMTKVKWNGQTVLMFPVDLVRHGSQKG